MFSFSRLATVTISIDFPPDQKLQVASCRVHGAASSPTGRAEYPTHLSLRAITVADAGVGGLLPHPDAVAARTAAAAATILTGTAASWLPPQELADEEALDRQPSRTMGGKLGALTPGDQDSLDCLWLWPQEPPRRRTGVPSRVSL